METVLTFLLVRFALIAAALVVAALVVFAVALRLKRRGRLDQVRGSLEPLLRAGLHVAASRARRGAGRS
ncbi:hypothetical protein [Streptomyces sp. NBC_01276]|uniref:hypothetical protein n=1 Tax=Streptomyces sp. NBC_01276 TaxID=2903808 RepID=UPI00352E48C9